MQTSQLGSIDYRDFIRGAGLAVLAAVIAMLGESMSKGVFTFDWHAIWHTAIYAFIAYLGHAFCSPAKVPVETTQAVGGPVK